MPDATPEPQVDPEKEELARLRAMALKFQPLESFADALEQDPSKIYALQAAMRGETPAAPQPQPQFQPERKLTQEELNELNARALQNPAEFMAAVAEQAVRNGLNQFGQQASPYMTTTAELFIETFKNSKSSDPLYKQIVPYFDKEAHDINKNTLLTMAPAERTRALSLRWDSAAAQVFRRAAASTTSAPNLGSGGSGGGGGSSAPKKQRVFEKDVAVNALTQNLIDRGLLTKEDIDAAQSEIDEENE